MIDVRPRAQFAKDGQFMDSSKVQEWKDQRAPAEVFDDIWSIQLYRIQPEVRMENGKDARVGQKGKHVRINAAGEEDDQFEFDTIYDFLAWVSRAMLDHLRNEELMDGASSAAREVEICEKCYYPKVRCNCTPLIATATPTPEPASTPVVQAGDEDFEVVEHGELMDGSYSALGSWLHTLHQTREYFSAREHQDAADAFVAPDRVREDLRPKI